MLITSLCGPFSALYVCGGLALLFVPLVIGGCLAVYLTSDVDPGKVGTADVASAAAATAIVAVYFLVAFYMIYWRNFESYFTSFPWLSTASSNQEKVGERTYQKKCPFTGLRPRYRCPSCQCRVNEKAFHPADKFILLPVGETILRWDLASAVAESDDTTNLDKLRSTLDEAMDYRGNMYTQSVSHCCIGCATWQKCFNLAPRLSLSLALTALFFAYVPWAFTSFLELIKGAGPIVKMITGSASVGFALAALLVQIRALGRTAAFLSNHSEAVPGLRPVKMMRKRKVTDALWKVLFSTTWDPLM